MSRSSSDSVRGLGVGALALILALAFSSWSATAWARTPRAKASPESARVVRQVETGPGGIRVDGESQEGPRNEDRGTDVRIGPGGVTVRTGAGDEDSGKVEVDIPGVHVHGGHYVSGSGSDAVVRAFSDIHVGKGEVIAGDVVAVCGSVSVEGHVQGDVVAVCGSVKLSPGAVVDGSAVAVGGVLDKPEGAHVGDESVSLGFLPVSFGLPTLPILLVTIFVGWLLTVFMSWLLSLLFATRVQRVAATVSRNPVGSFFLGLVSLPACVILFLLLFVTVIGMPIALLLPVFYVLAVWTGQIAATSLLGCRLIRRVPGESSPFVPAVVGSLFVALFFFAGAVLAAPQGMMVRSLSLFFTLLGLLLVTGLSILGTGAFLLSRAGGRPREPRPAVPAPAAGPLPAPPPIAG